MVDAKRYKGKVERRDVGSLFKIDNRLYVGTRDCTKLVVGVHRQLEVARTVLDGSGIPISGGLCFVEAEWGLFTRPFVIDGIWIGWPKALGKWLTAEAVLSEEAVTTAAARLSSKLPPA